MPAEEQARVTAHVEATMARFKIEPFIVADDATPKVEQPRWLLSDLAIAAVAQTAFDLCMATIAHQRGSDAALREVAIASAVLVANAGRGVELCPYPEGDPARDHWIPAFEARKRWLAEQPRSAA